MSQAASPMKRSLLRHSKLVHSESTTDEGNKYKMKEELDDWGKKVEEKRMKLEYLSQNSLKCKSRMDILM